MTIAHRLVRDTRRPQYVGKRQGVIYGYNTLAQDSATGGQVEVGYVGQTIQPLASRDRQHRGLAPQPDGTPAKCQPWSDIIVGGVYIIEQGSWTCDEIDEREEFHIRRLRPRYNSTHNGSNEWRVPLAVAQRQRDERDRRAGLEPRDWSDCRPAKAPDKMSLASRLVRALTPTTAKRRKRRDTAVKWGALWAVVTILAVYGLNRAVDQPWMLDLRAAALAGLLPGPLWHGWAAHYLPGTRQTRRQRHTARLAAAVVIAVLLWFLAPVLGVAP